MPILFLTESMKEEEENLCSKEKEEGNPHQREVPLVIYSEMNGWFCCWTVCRFLSVFLYRRRTWSSVLSIFVQVIMDDPDERLNERANASRRVAPRDDVQARSSSSTRT